MLEEFMAVDETQEDTDEKTTRVRLRWFPLIWLILSAGACLGIQFSGQDQDVMNTATLGSLIVFFLGCSTWIFFCSGLPRKRRLAIGLIPWGIALAFFSTIELVNNGDVGFVGWQWRWGTKPDEALVVPEQSTQVISEWRTTAHDYPRFLGNGYWAEVPDVQLATDWSTRPPQEKWRCDVGAGWSGFALVGDYAITQEQRGEQELVVCYRISTDKPDGEVVWSHADPVRFNPGGAGGLGGIGPRATPTVYDGKVLTMGATGILNCLDARSGKRLWSHDTLVEADLTNIMWGKANSPLIVEQEAGPTLVVASVGAPKGSLVAYDIETGKEVWSAGVNRSSYATPILAELLGESLILSVNEDLITAHHVVDGEIVWEQEWLGNSDSDATVSQPIPLPNDRLFLSKGYGIGSSLLQLSRNDNGKIVAESLWSPAIRNVMKTKMGNVVIRDGHVYGLDGGILQCIDLESGKNQWKKRRLPAIGHGQIMLVGNAIVVLSESGELILVEPTPEKYRELAAMRVFPDDQVTWNNPAFSSPYLLLRNGDQAVCLEMPLIEDSTATAQK
jgi:outer membrane protein assembly factor BamB